MPICPIGTWVCLICLSGAVLGEWRPTQDLDLYLETESIAFDSYHVRGGLYTVSVYSYIRETNKKCTL